MKAAKDDSINKRLLFTGPIQYRPSTENQFGRLPTWLGYAGNLTTGGHTTETDSADTILPQKTPGPTA